MKLKDKNKRELLKGKQKEIKKQKKKKLQE
jgi:hypothetical protein